MRIPNLINKNVTISILVDSGLEKPIEMTLKGDIESFLDSTLESSDGVPTLTVFDHVEMWPFVTPI